FEPTENNDLPKVVGDTPVSRFAQNGIAACSDTATPGPENVDTPADAPLTGRQRFLQSVEAEMDGRYMLHEDGTIILLGTRSDERICDALRVDRMEIDPKGAETMLIVERLDEDDVVEVPIPAEHIGSSSPLIANILRQAKVRVFARDGKLADLLRSFAYKIVEATRVMPGWSADGSRAFGLSDNQYVVSDKHCDAVTLVAERHVPDDQQVEDWKERVGSKLVGNPYALFMMCTALSGPMLDLLGWRGGIFNFAFPTSSAKTTGLIIANHVWRVDAPFGWKNTRPFQDDACLAANGTFLALDEVPEDSLPTVENVVFSVCNGVRRGARPAPGQKIEHGGWNTVAASTSEYPVWELAQADAAKGKNSSGVRGKRMRIKEGTFVRLIDVGGREEAMWQSLHGCPSKGLFLRSVERCSAELAGVIGPAFVHRLLNNHELLGRDLRSWHSRWMERLAIDLGIDPDVDDGANMRVLGHFAAVWLAGDRAASMGILPCFRDEVEKAVLTAAHFWARIRGIGKYEIREDPVTLIRDFVLPRLGKALREVGPDRKPLGKTAYAEAGWFNEHSYFLRPSAIRAFVQTKARFDKDMKGLVQDFCHALEEAGALVRGGAQHSMQVRMADSIECGCRVYMLRRDVIDDRGDEE
ncbi:MAG: DUF927 domain-containing protein, partial [Paracoccaceae bacterium]